MTSFHYTLLYRYKCRSGSGVGSERVVLTSPLTSVAEARKVLCETATIKRDRLNPLQMKQPWPQVVKVIQTDKDGVPLKPLDPEFRLQFP